MIAVFLHTIVSGGSVPVNTEAACEILHEQMTALKDSGLLAEADEFYIGVNGSQDDADIVRMFCPCPEAKFIVHGPGATTEIPTMKALRAWLAGHEGWKVLYSHLKGLTHPHDPFYDRWRRRMTKHVIWNWRQCVADLEDGCDACGCHWLTPEQFPNLVKSPFFGGTFWWAMASFLMTLPPLPPATWANRFEAESWIGRGARRSKVNDYAPGWP